MTRMAFIALVAVVLVATGAVAYLRRRTGGPEYEVQPAFPDAARRDEDLQLPDYYGGERLGRREGYEHYPARAQTSRR